MAKDKTGPDGTEQVTAAEVEKNIPPKKLKELLNNLDRAQEDIDELRGGMGGVMTAAVEKYHLDKKMIGWIRQLRRLSAEKLADKLAKFNYYLDASGLSDKAKSAQRLPLDEEAGEAEPSATVTPIRGGTTAGAQA